MPPPPARGPHTQDITALGVCVSFQNPLLACGRDTDTLSACVDWQAVFSQGCTLHLGDGAHLASLGPQRFSG